MLRQFRGWNAPAGTVPSALALALGVSAGVAAYFVWRKRSRGREVELPSDLAQIEESAVAALSNDSRVGHRAIEVAAVSAGIIELTGDVETIEEAHHAVGIAQNVDGVHTVINRLMLDEPERHFAATRSRFFAGDAALQGTHWEGMNLGMGQRRQSQSTEPDRPDDHVRAIDRALEPDAPEAYAEPPAGEGTDAGSPQPDERYGDEEDRGP